MAKGFPWRFGVYLVLATYLVADMVLWHGPLYQRLVLGAPWQGTGDAGLAASVYGEPITRLTLEQRLAEQLWRRGETWAQLSHDARQQSRTLALESLINDGLIRAHRHMNGLRAEPSPKAVNEELTQFMRQFHLDGDYARRLALHRQTEATLTQQMSDALADEQWIEEKIAARLAEVDEAAARAWLREHAHAMELPERWRVAHVFLSGHNPIKDAADKVIGTADREAEIRAMHARLTSGQSSFDTLATTVSEDERAKKASGDLGWFSLARMPADFTLAVRALKVGETSAPVKTKLGWHLIRLLDHQPAQPVNAEQPSSPQLSEVQAILLAERREAAVKALIAELRETAAKPPGFVKRFPAVIAEAEPR